MTLDFSDCTFQGPALPQPFVRFELSDLLAKLGLLTNQHGKLFERNWTALRRGLRATGGPQSLCNHIIAPLAQHLGFEPPLREAPVVTREGWRTVAGYCAPRAVRGSAVGPSQAERISMYPLAMGGPIAPVRCAASSACCWHLANRWVW
jgi:hypothetical protein